MTKERELITLIRRLHMPAMRHSVLYI